MLLHIKTDSMLKIVVLLHARPFIIFSKHFPYFFSVRQAKLYYWPVHMVTTSLQ